MIKKSLSLVVLLSGIVFGEQCQITSPLPMPITIQGCTYSGSLPSNSTSYIQNTLSPTTTTQVFSVQTATVTGNFTLSNVTPLTVLATNAQGVVVSTTISSSGGGGGGSPNGSINNANQYLIPRYSVAGSSNVLSGTTGFNAYPSSIVISNAFETYTSTLNVSSSMTIVGVATMTFVNGASFDSTSGNANIGHLLFNGNSGTSGQVPVSGGVGSTPTWTTLASGGASALAVATGSIAGFTTPSSSPTAVINLDSTYFTSNLTGSATAFIGVTPAISSVATDTTSLRTTLTSVAASTAAIATSTASLQSQVTALGVSTNTLAVSTGSLQAQVTALGVSTNTLAVSTGSLQTQVTALGVSTNTLAVSTGSLYTLINTKLSASSITATSPIQYDPSTKVISASLISLSTQVTGTLPAANMVSTVAFTNSTQTFSGANSFTSTSAFSGQMFISTNVVINGSQGSSGQVVTSSGTGFPPYWSTVSGGSGSGIVSPGTFTWVNTSFGINVSTITASTITILQNGATVMPLTNNPLVIGGNVDGFLQANIQNQSAGTNASGDYVVTGDLGGNTTFYANFGMNSSKYNQASYSATPASWSYLLSSDAGLALMSGVNGTDPTASLVFVTSLPVTSNIRMAITASGTIQTFGNLNISSGLQTNNNPGTSGQVITSSGPNLPPYWSTIAGSGDMILASTQTVTGAKTFTSTAAFQGQVFISSNFVINGSQGTNGQVVKSSGPNLPPYWGTGGGFAVSITSYMVGATTTVYQIPTGATFLKIKICGGGGGGGGGFGAASSTEGGGSGGGGGACNEAIFNVSADFGVATTSFNVIVGTGGVGGVGQGNNSPTAGTAGNASSIFTFAGSTIMYAGAGTLGVGNANNAVAGGAGGGTAQNGSTTSGGQPTGAANTVGFGGGGGGTATGAVGKNADFGGAGGGAGAASTTGFAGGASVHGGGGGGGGGAGTLPATTATAAAGGMSGVGGGAVSGGGGAAGTSSTTSCTDGSAGSNGTFGIGGYGGGGGGSLISASASATGCKGGNGGACGGGGGGGGAGGATATGTGGNGGKGGPGCVFITAF